MVGRCLFFLVEIALLMVMGGGVNASDLLSIEPKIGVGAMASMAYDPQDARNFACINGFLLFDYDRVWGHRAPENLKFKSELSLGTTTGTGDLILSFGIEALLYLNSFETRHFRPYVEAGIGIAYTGHTVEGQGLHLNFNPRAGVGTEVEINGTSSLFCSLRLWHLSNGGLYSDNRGSNAVVLLIGRYLNLMNQP